jgi:hypothetical protein
MSSWKVQLPFIPKSDINPHRTAHEVRHNAELLVQRIVKASKLQGYDIQQGGSDQPGTGYLLDPVDTKPGCSEPDDSIRILVDVDYYVNMPQLLKDFRPIVMYTFAPQSVTGNADSIHYWFEGDVCHYQSHGGYTCSHQIWNYPSDYLTSTYWRYFLFPVTTWYRLKRVSFPHGRQVILLVPHIKLPWWLYWCSSLINREAAKLKRLKVTHGCWAAFETWIADKLYVTFAHAGRFSQALTLPHDTVARAVDAFRSIGGQQLSQHNATVISEERFPFVLEQFAPFLAAANPTLDVTHSGTPLEIVPPESREAKAPDAPKPQTAPKTLDIKRRVECACSLHNTEGDKETAQGLAYTAAHPKKLNIIRKATVGVTPVGPNAVRGNPVVSPIRDPVNKTIAQQKRVLEVQQKAQKTVASLKVLRPKFKAFVDHLEKLGLLDVTKMPDDEAIARIPAKNREKQREGLYAFPIFSNPKIFIKAETYDSLKDPRIIAPLDPTVQVRMYPYVYPLQDKLHAAKWFAFGCSPDLLATRIAAMSRDAAIRQLVCIETDMSRYDGSITPNMRVLENMIYERAFGRDSQILKLTPMTCGFKTQGKSTGGARSSGAPDTCLMNSYLNMFMLYNAIGEDAFNWSVVGGDDGICFADPAKIPAVERSAKECGFTLKCLVRQPGEPFSFLARYFQWGGRDSICDPARTMLKIHISSCANLPQRYHLTRYYEKLHPLRLSDGNTPVVGEYIADELLRISGAKLIQVPDAYQEDNWKKRVGVEGGAWPNQLQPWMAPLIESRIRRNGNLLELVT